MTASRMTTGISKGTGSNSIAISMYEPIDLSKCP